MGLEKQPLTLRHNAPSQGAHGPGTTGHLAEICRGP